MGSTFSFCFLLLFLLVSQVIPSRNPKCKRGLKENTRKTERERDERMRGVGEEVEGLWA